MSIVLYHHPFSRAATVVWMLEALAVPYELRFIDILGGAQHRAAQRTNAEIAAAHGLGR